MRPMPNDASAARTVRVEICDASFDAQAQIAEDRRAEPTLEIELRVDFSLLAVVVTAFGETDTAAHGRGALEAGTNA